MLDTFLEKATIALRAVVKAVTGFIIVPVGIIVSEVMPAWREAPTLIKWVTGVVILPMYGFSRVAGPWWEDFDIVD